MSIEPKRITLNELSDNLARIIDLVLASNERIVVEKEDGGVVSIVPEAVAPKSDADLAVFMSAAGSWSDMDSDRLIEEIYSSRNASSRPPVAL